jgi:hypothetical protein
VGIEFDPMDPSVSRVEGTGLQSLAEWLGALLTVLLGSAGGVGALLGYAILGLCALIGLFRRAVR